MPADGIAAGTVQLLANPDVGKNGRALPPYGQNTDAVLADFLGDFEG